MSAAVLFSTEGDYIGVQAAGHDIIPDGTWVIAALSGLNTRWFNQNRDIYRWREGVHFCYVPASSLRCTGVEAHRFVSISKALLLLPNVAARVRAQRAASAPVPTFKPPLRAPAPEVTFSRFDGTRSLISLLLVI